jgi:hypothetical protein
MCALDDTLSHYRYTSQDATRGLSEKLKYVLRRIVAAYALDIENVLFIDKSQLYTINVGFKNKLLEGHDPFFVLVLRDPYAMCSRVTNKYYLSGSKNGFSFSRSECLKLCSEHWRNSYACALRDFSEGANSILLRFEDLISELEATVAMLCARLSINFEGDMLPSAHQKYTIYSRAASGYLLGPFRLSLSDGAGEGVAFRIRSQPPRCRQGLCFGGRKTGRIPSLQGWWPVGRGSLAAERMERAHRLAHEVLTAHRVLAAGLAVALMVGGGENAVFIYFQF